MNIHINGESQLGSNAISSTDQYWIYVSYGLDVKYTTKSPDFWVRAWPTRRTDQRLDSLNKGISRVNGDSGLSVCQTTRFDRI